MALSVDLFFTLLFAAIYFFYYELIDPKLKPRDVPQKEIKDVYDFVIVGGGIGGCVLANRLTEYPKWTVLLIEAGGDDTAESNVPLLHLQLLGTELDWNFTTVPQKKVCLDNNGVCNYHRGKVLGGTSSIFSSLYTRANGKDYNLNTVKYNLTEWNFDEKVLPYYIKTENSTGLNLPHSKYRGYNGQLHIGYAKYRMPIQKDYIKAGKEMGWRHGDYNGRVQEGMIDYPQLTIDGASRYSAAKAYLYPIKHRKNLAIIKHSYVYKINVDGRRAVGVEYIRDGRKCTVKARKEVIIAAGVINSPKLLMLSGIGPKDNLAKHRIPVISNLSVGKCLQDQIRVLLYFEVKKNVTLTSNIWRTKESILNYARYKRGPLTTNGFGAIAFNGQEKSPYPPTLSYIFYLGFHNFDKPYDAPHQKQVITVGVTLLHPLSTGTLTLKSNDPFEDPLIDPKYLANQTDYTTLRDGLKVVFKFMNTKAMRKYSPKIYTKTQPKCKKSMNKDKYITCVMKNYVVSQYRPTCTARVGGGESDPDGVLSERLLVFGFENIRVVGSAVIPGSASGSPYGSSYVIGEKVADFIKEDYLQPR